MVSQLGRRQVAAIVVAGVAGVAFLEFLFSKNAEWVSAGAPDGAILHSTGGLLRGNATQSGLPGCPESNAQVSALWDMP